MVLNSPETVEYLFAKHCKEDGIAVIEGVMGLYDGCGFQSIGSTASLSVLLDAPVILVVNGKSASESICATILGFRNYDEKVNIKGVILNNIHGNEFYGSIKRLIKEKTGIDCVGYLRSNMFKGLKERHLGLVPTDELAEIDGYIENVSELASETIDMDAVLSISDETELKTENNPLFNITVKKNIKIGIARDRAFNFYYEDNLQLLKESGMDLVPFSPCDDKNLPDNIDAVYIGGGYPEVYAKDLSSNLSFLEDLRIKLENGLPCYAECGGFMYLSEYIKDKSGNKFKMTGFFNTGSVMTERLQRFGYVDVEYEGVVTRAHEFHYSDFEFADNNNFEFKYKVKRAFGDKEWICGLSRKNVLAGYAHVHFYSSPEFFIKIADLFIK